MKIIQIMKRAIAAIGRFMGKSLHAIGALIILFAGVFVSFGHTVALYVSGAGYQDLQALVIAISFETMFIMSSGVMISRKLKGRGIPKYTKYGFWFGLAVVTWGNIRYSLRPEVGFVGNIEPVLLEIAVVAIVFFGEAIFGEAVVSEDDEETEQEESEEKESKGATKQKGSKRRPAPEPWRLRIEPPGTSPENMRRRDTHTQHVHNVHTYKKNVRTPLVNEKIGRINHLLDEKDKRFMQENAQTVLACAQYLDKNKEFPSIRGLAKIANTKENRSRRVIEILKAIERGGEL